MNAYVLIMAIVTFNGMALTSVPFDTIEACHAAAKEWQAIKIRDRAQITIKCHATGKSK